MATKYVVLYESADDVMSKAPAQFPAHKRTALLWCCSERLQARERAVV
jgi:hypothetical protein